MDHIGSGRTDSREIPSESGKNHTITRKQEKAGTILNSKDITARCTGAGLLRHRSLSLCIPKMKTFFSGCLPLHGKQINGIIMNLCFLPVIYHLCREFHLLERKRKEPKQPGQWV